MRVGVRCGEERRGGSVVGKGRNALGNSAHKNELGIFGGSDDNHR